MKTLVNKVTEIDKGNGEKIKFSDLAESCINHTPKEGYSVAEMKARLNVLGKIDHEKETIELEDAEADKLAECVAVMPWVIMHKDVVEFSDAVKEM